MIASKVLEGRQKMRKKIHFTKSEWDGKNLILKTDQKETFPALKASGQMIVDSDQFAFIYLAEDKDEYIYLYIHEPVWADLHKALQTDAAVKADIEGEILELTQFSDELSYLIHNIEGNSNYGEEMVAKVESVFFEK
jgi:hypothetical protein